MSLNKYWEDYPPIHILIAGFMGYKKPEKPATNNNLADFFNAVPQTKLPSLVVKNGN